MAYTRTHYQYTPSGRVTQPTPMYLRPEPDEEAWWRRAFAARGITDPDIISGVAVVVTLASGAKEKRECLTNSPTQSALTW